MHLYTCLHSFLVVVRLKVALQQACDCSNNLVAVIARHMAERVVPETAAGAGNNVLAQRLLLVLAHGLER